MATKSKPRIRKHLGPNIKLARVALEMTQLELAHKIGYNGPDAGAYISRVEGGYQEPRLETLQAISKAVGVSIETLLTKPKTATK